MIDLIKKVFKNIILASIVTTVILFVTGNQVNAMDTQDVIQPQLPVDSLNQTVDMPLLTVPVPVPTMPQEEITYSGKAPEEQILDEDKEADVEDNSRHFPKWQGRRKRTVKDYDYSIRVNKKTNTVTVYIKDEKGELTPYKAMVCSIGREGHDTPEGKGYKTSDYYDWRLMVDGTYGRYAVRFNGSIMFHSVPYYKSKKNTLEWQDYNKLGSPASLGCIRLAVADAKWIFDNCKRGTEVEVYNGPASTDPLGTPTPIKLDTSSEYRDWDPTDLTPENPWLVPVE